MATKSVTCTSCSKGQSFYIPDDHDGTRVVWECADCGARNETDGMHPTELVAIQDAEALAQARELVASGKLDELKALVAAGGPDPSAAQVSSGENALVETAASGAPAGGQ
jgi:hypothetical protein